MKKLILPVLLFGCVIMFCACHRAMATVETESPVREEPAVEESAISFGKNSEESIQKETKTMEEYDFSIFANVEITGIDIDSLDPEEQSLLYRQAEYCQAMTDADIDKLREIVSEDKTFTHMSGKTQSREEYFDDIDNGYLIYFLIGIEDPVIEIAGDKGSITYTSVLNANAYGSEGTYRISGTHYYELIDGEWIAVNG